MTRHTLPRMAKWILGGLLVTPAIAQAQQLAPAAPERPRTPPPMIGIRYKVSAGDLLSAESILEVHRNRIGEDDDYLVGLSWLARGALYLSDQRKAKRYADDIKARCAKRIAQGVAIGIDQALETALGAAIEVEAQLIAQDKGGDPAAAYVRGELARLEGAPIALRSRLNKRLNMLTLTGTAAPELVVEDHLGGTPPTLAALRGRPVVIFLFAFGCPDCHAQVTSLARMMSRYADKSLQIVALTRFYGAEANRIAERAQLEAVWKSVFADLGATPVVLSTASMERYGGSSTPTFIFIDRAGIVRSYTPTRLTEAELERAAAAIVR